LHKVDDYQLAKLTAVFARATLLAVLLWQGHLALEHLQQPEVQQQQAETLQQQTAAPGTWQATLQVSSAAQVGMAHTAKAAAAAGCSTCCRTAAACCPLHLGLKLVLCRMVMAAALQKGLMAGGHAAGYMASGHSLLAAGRKWMCR
jgi:hypothetical protein